VHKSFFFLPPFPLATARSLVWAFERVGGLESMCRHFRVQKGWKVANPGACSLCVGGVAWPRRAQSRPAATPEAATSIPPLWPWPRPTSAWISQVTSRSPVRAGGHEMLHWGRRLELACTRDELRSTPAKINNCASDYKYSALYDMFADRLLLATILRESRQKEYTRRLIFQVWSKLSKLLWKIRQHCFHQRKIYFPLAWPMEQLSASAVKYGENLVY
jgi:hypothetical protein